MARKILYPFARSGDRSAVPDISEDGYVGYDIGYGFDYQRQLGVDPLFKVIERKSFNQYMYDITSGIQDWQLYGVAPWFAVGTDPGDTGYPKNAIVRYGKDLYLSLVDNNTTEPTTPNNQWELQKFTQDVLAMIPLPYQGVAGSSGDFRAQPYLSNGTWDFDSDSKVAAFSNAPPGAKSGVLETRVSTNYIIQVYRDGSSSVYIQSYDASLGWVGWRTMVGQGQVIRTDSDNLVNMSGKDWNSFNQGGIYAVADFNGANRPPVSTSASDFGILEVVSVPPNNVMAQVVTKYLDGNQTEVFYRLYVNGVWTGWMEGDGRNKVNKSGDTMTGRLTLKGQDPNYLYSPELYFQIAGLPNGMCIRGSTDSGRTGSIQIVNAAYNAVLFEMSNEGVFYCNTQRPQFAGQTPWDTGNFDPNGKVPVRGGLGSNGYVENLNGGNAQYLGWNGNWYYQVDGSYLGILWTSANFDPNSKAQANAQCQWQGDKSTEGPIANTAGFGFEISGDRFLTGTGGSGGGSTANDIFISGRTMRNN